MSDAWKSEARIRHKPTKEEQYTRGQSAVQCLAHRPHQTEARSMTDIITTAPQSLVMSSREIARVCKKRHDNVVRDIEKMLADLNHLRFEAVDLEAQYQDAKGEWRKEYRLPKDLTFTLITGYRADLRYKVIKRVEELERASGVAVMPHGLPTEAVESIDRVLGITKMLAHKVTQIERSVPALVNSLLEPMITARLAEGRLILRYGKTAKQIWDSAALPGGIKGSATWFGNRLHEMGCSTGKGEQGSTSVRLFDPDKAAICMRSGLLQTARRYAYERQGQGRLQLV